MTAPRRIASVLVPQSTVLTSNQRQHWTVSSPSTKALRMLGRNLGARCLDPVSGLVAIDVHVWKPTRVRYDPANLYPTAKALVDGLRDAGILAEDDWRHVDGPHLHHGGIDPTLRRNIRLQLTITPKD